MNKYKLKHHDLVLYNIDIHYWSRYSQYKDRDLLGEFIPRYSLFKYDHSENVVKYTTLYSSLLKSMYEK